MFSQPASSSFRSGEPRQDYHAARISGVENAAYYYSTYNAPDASTTTNRRKIMILGGGPNRIGQGIEFDYCCVRLHGA